MKVPVTIMRGKDDEGNNYILHFTAGGGKLVSKWMESIQHTLINMDEEDLDFLSELAGKDQKRYQETLYHILSYTGINHQ